MVEKSLDRKLRAIQADPNCKEFILADAKDADMAFGIGAPGLSPEAHPGETRFRTLKEYRDIIREVVRQELVDIMLMSASTNEVLTIHERIFENSPVTPAARCNDTSDIHVVRGGVYHTEPSVPFRSATLDHIQCGHLDCQPHERQLGANLGLYSVTFNNSLEEDLLTLTAFKEFRHEAEKRNFRYFLEVFDPNAGPVVDPKLQAGYINDMIARCLAGVTSAGRPLFLKIVYHGPEAMEELFRYDPSLIIGIMGGSSGTTYDAFKLLAEAQKYGAKVALYGRKINNAENQFAFIRFLRLIVDGVISPEEAVRAYHAVLERLGIRPHRSLEEDMVLQTNVMSYGGSSTTTSIPGITPGGTPVPPPAKPAVTPAAHPASQQPETNGAYRGYTVANRVERPFMVVGASKNGHGDCGCHGTNGQCLCDNANAGVPDFKTMNSEQRLKYHRQRIARLLGEH